MTQTQTSPQSLFLGAPFAGGVIESLRFYVQTNVSMARVWLVGASQPILVRLTDEE